MLPTPSQVKNATALGASKVQRSALCVPVTRGFYMANDKASAQALATTREQFAEWRRIVQRNEIKLSDGELCSLCIELVAAYVQGQHELATLDLHAPALVEDFEQMWQRIMRAARAEAEIHCAVTVRP